MKALIVIAGIFLVSFQVIASESLLTEDIAGTWQLVEWIDGDDVQRPPLVGGFFSLHDGSFTWIVYNQSGNEKLYQSGFGKYTIDGNVFRYGYDFSTTTRQSSEGSSVVVENWPYETFTPTYEQDGLRLANTDENGEWGFIVRENSLIYFEYGEILRVYNRVIE